MKGALLMVLLAPLGVQAASLAADSAQQIADLIAYLNSTKP
jgi:hypothetical protein